MNLPLREFADIVAALKGPGGASGGGESRRAARMSVSAKIDVHLIEREKIGRSFSALTRDISLSGVGLLQSVALPEKSQVVLTLPRSTKPIFVLSSVTHCRTLADGLLAVGMEFVRIMDEASSKAMLNRDAEERARVQRSILS